MHYLVCRKDGGIFDPCYRRISLYIQCQNNTPLLLLSARCHPVAVDGIMKVLKLSGKTILSSSMLNLDLLYIFPPKDDVLDDHVVSALIYNTAHRRPGACGNPRGSFYRQYNLFTGEKDKTDIVKDTWVVSKLEKTLNMCGKNGKNGLSILFLQPSQKGGRREISDFKNPNQQTDELAINPIFPFVEFNTILDIFTLLQKILSMCKNNCEFDSSLTLIQNLKHVNKNNINFTFDNSFNFKTNTLAFILKCKCTQRQAGSTNNFHWEDSVVVYMMQFFKLHMLKALNDLNEEQFGNSAWLSPHYLFNMKHCDLIISALEGMNTLNSLIVGI
ncbi:uncharacterized protein VP01_2752g4 [Puccinia sorghi]|uniref:Uncharacterized protein n=1 Tax=Puccinia sorghi TaxID=27349 RepID=A0A0L6V327_9BASI|nr:uncharacterized protein VP01_2752g4 [Puccinia sorghi]